jgi:hypothetical protein
MYGQQICHWLLKGENDETSSHIITIITQNHKPGNKHITHIVPPFNAISSI